MITTYHIPLLTIFLAFLLAMGALAIIGNSVAEADEQRISCDALRGAGLNPQQLFDQDPVKYKKLDRDKDKKVCE